MNILNKVTRKTLNKNKVRTLVTIIGIVLSAAMFTGVMTTVTSMQNYMLRNCQASDGSYYARMTDCNDSELSNFDGDTDIKDYRYLQNIGYAYIESNNEYKPYLFVGGISENFTDIVAVNITEGRMPESTDEIILPKHLITNGGNRNYQVGDKITLNIGQRQWNDVILTQQDPYYAYDNDEDEVVQNAEELIDTRERTFTVVGFYERPSFEPYSAAGYTALTVCDDGSGYNYDIFYQTQKIRKIYTVAERLDPNTERTYYNSQYLRFCGVSLNDGFNSMLYTMAAILSLIIMFGSISLIYNAFSISVSERTKQFGILKSVGATKRQMRRSVIYEGMLLCVIGIPLGILAGIAGIFITFKFIGELFDLINGSSNVEFKLYVTWWSIVISSVICLVTVLISVNIPAKKAAKRPAIEAIRQSGDVVIKRNKVKTSRLTYKLFGFEGMLAAKNFKRNKKKYRATVASLFVSIVLFISASGFCDYLTKGFGVAVQEYNYDISFTLMGDDVSKISVDELKSIINDIEGITDTTYMATGKGWYVNVDDTISDNHTIEKLNEYYGEAYVDVIQCFVEDDKYREFLEKQGLDADIYMNVDEPVAVAYDKIVLYSDKYIKIDVFSGDELTLSVADDDNENSVEYIKIGAVVEHPPMGIVENSTQVVLMYPYSAFEAVMGDDYERYIYYSMNSDDHQTSYDKLCEILDDKGLTVYSEDIAQQISSLRALISILKIFSYGFIVLISLISIANVFNTISTNVGLRRREFAMLKSVGMTKKGFNRMMNYECLLYGIKGIIYGLPVSILINWFMSRSIEFGVSLGFIMPWKSIIIAVASVFIVVFITMLYSMNKIRHDNTVETLKNENL